MGSSQEFEEPKVEEFSKSASSPMKTKYTKHEGDGKDITSSQ